MNDLLLYLTEINQQHQAWITWGGVLIFLSGLLIFVWPALVQRWKAWRMLRCINRHSEAVLRDVFLADGVEGVHYFPFIILTRQVILFFKTMQFRGIIFAAETIDYWTQVVGKRSYKFHNPMPGLEAETASLKAIDKKMSVEGRVVFPADSHFPKGRPAAVMLESEIKSLLQEKMHGDLSMHATTSWQLLQAAVNDSRQEKHDSLLMGKGRQLSDVRSRMSWLFALAAMAWLALHFL
ncbi:MAG: hypothetical protein R6X06_12740 [Gammaproteobacteria bacterium]